MAKQLSEFNEKEMGVFVVLCMIAFPLLFVFGFAVLMAIAAGVILAVNVLAGHAVIALTWTSVLAGAALLWVIRLAVRL